MRIKRETQQGIANDFAVSLGLYRFIYLIEYTYMFIIFTMAFILASQYADLYADIENINKSLEQKIQERTKELVEKAHQAGMADIAVEILHNVGNILNSINASIEEIRGALKRNPLQELINANKLLSNNMERLDEFICVDPKGRKLLQYYLKIEEPLKTTFITIDSNVQRLNDKVSSMSNVIAAQQSYAGVGGLLENVKLSDLVDDTLTMESESFTRYDISIVKDYTQVPTVWIQKAKLVHILFNLIKNAKGAMAEYCSGKKTIAISIKQEGAEGPIFIRVKDNGCGIKKENMTKIFSYGFTTKKKGHGFGLHSSVNYMKEMGGEMWAESEGEKKGTTFVLKFDITPRT
jgi:C4-dicarboxylate-specific signal transduction histidine kinase